MRGDAVEEIASRILARLGDAWNAGNGTAFGEPFAVDTDFVAIRVDYHRGRDAIGQLGRDRRTPDAAGTVDHGGLRERLPSGRRPR